MSVCDFGGPVRIARTGCGKLSKSLGGWPSGVSHFSCHFLSALGKAISLVGNFGAILDRFGG